VSTTACLLVSLVLLVLSLPKAVQGGLTYTLLKGSGSNCLSVDPLPGSTLEIEYHLPDLKVKEDIEDGTVKEELNTEGMDQVEAAMLQRQREVAIKRVSTLPCYHVHEALVFTSTDSYNSHDMT
jgi:hypothetical protein